MLYEQARQSCILGDKGENAKQWLKYLDLFYEECKDGGAQYWDTCGSETVLK